MKGKNLFILFIGITLLLNTCKKDEEIETSFEEAIRHEALSEEEVAILDNLESVELSIDKILLPNGLTVDDFLKYYELKSRINGNEKNSSTVHEDPEDITNIMFTEIFSTALILTDRKRYQYEEAENAPKQNGLAYSYGQRDYTVREVPPEGKCSERLYGLDCSGFIFQLFIQSGIDLRNAREETWAEQQRDPNLIKNAIINQYDEISEVLIVKELGKIDSTEFKSGDIIYFLKTDDKGNKSAYHIGMVILTTSGKLRIAQSNGRGLDITTDDCAKNYSINRGPRIVPLAPALKPGWQGGLGGDYTIIRIEVEKVFDFGSCFVEIEVPGQYKYFNLISDTSYTLDADITLGAVCNGSFTGNTFTGSYTDATLPNLTINGSINAFIDGSKTKIDSVIWNEQWIHPDYTVNKALNARNIPLDNFDDDQMYFFISGEVVTNHIITLKDEQTSEVGGYVINSYESKADSYIVVEFFNE